MEQAITIHSDHNSPKASRIPLPLQRALAFGKVTGEFYAMRVLDAHIGDDNPRTFDWTNVNVPLFSTTTATGHCERPHESWKKKHETTTKNWVWWVQMNERVRQCRVVGEPSIWHARSMKTDSKTYFPSCGGSSLKMPSTHIHIHQI